MTTSPGRRGSATPLAAIPSSPDSGLPAIDVVIPVYLPGPWLDTCLGSVFGSRGVSVRVWVVDDLPGDPRVREVALAHEGVKLIVSPRNLRYASAANLGIAAGSSEYVLLLNQDARVDPACLARLAGWLRADPSLGVVGCRVLHQPSPDEAPDGLVDSMGIEMRRGRRAVDIGQGERDGPQWLGRRRVFGVCAAVALYRRDALQQVARGVNVFDARFVMHKEDVDLAWRLQRAGFGAGIDGDVVAFHARGTKRLSDLEAPDAARFANRARSVLRQERRKSASVRRLAWRNHLLLLIKNDTPAGLRTHFIPILELQLGYLVTGLLLDPWGTIAGRLAAIGPLVAALLERRSWQPTGRIGAQPWLE